MKDPPNRGYRFDEVVIDVPNLKVTVSSEVRPLEPKSFRLLLFLIENPGRALPKEEIMAVVWPDTSVSDNSLARAIAQIRKALDDDPKAPRYIETVPSVGYRFLTDCKEEIKENEGTAPNPLPEPRADSGRRFPTWPWLTVAAGGILLTVLAVVYFRGAPLADGPEMRLEINTAATNDPRSFALSPDGRQLAYVATAEGQSRLWVRRLASTKAQPLTVTENGAAYPFWSPDSRSIGFFSGGKLKRIEASGGLPQTVADATSGRGGTWNQDGVILFTPSSEGPLFRVQASGGTATQVTKLESWSNNHRFAQFLPDGKHYLFFEESSPDKPRSIRTGSICLGSLESADYKRLTLADTAGLYMPPGWLLWVRAGALVAANLNLTRGELSRDATTVADPVFFDTSHARLFSASATGLVAYRNGTPVSQLRWFNRSGKELGALAEPADNDGYLPSNARIAPDGRRVAVYRRARDQNDIWLVDQTHSNRFTFGGAGFPVWSGDSRQIIFSKGPVLYLKPADSAQSEEQLALPWQDGSPNDWSADGRFLLYHRALQQTGYDVWIVPMDGDRKPRPYLQSKFDEKYARFSPDGHWVAYVSTETGRAEVYVREFADLVVKGVKAGDAGAVWQVSVEGGLFPAWRHDGRELYWVGPGGRMMAAPLTVKGKTLEPGMPVALFQPPIFGGGLDVNTGGAQFDVSPDGRFLINTVKDSAATAITLLQNWKPK